MASQCRLDVAEDELVGISLPRFDPSESVPPTRATLSPGGQCRGGVKVLVVGPPGSGKSYFMRWLMLSKAAVIPTYVVVSGTERESGFYGSVVPPAFVYHEPAEEVFRRVIHRQQAVVGEPGRSPWTMLVVDDCASFLKVTKGASQKLQEDLLKNGRHWKLDYVVGVQDIVDVPLTLRASFDYVVLFSITNQARRRMAAEMFGAAFLNQQMFFDVYAAVTSAPHTALVIRNNCQDITAAVSWGRAPATLPAHVKLGSVEYRCFARAVLDAERDAKYRGRAAPRNQLPSEAVFSEDEGGEF